MAPVSGLLADMSYRLVEGAPVPVRERCHDNQQIFLGQRINSGGEFIPQNFGADEPAAQKSFPVRIRQGVFAG